MEFDFNINTLFRDTITVITGNAAVPHRHDRHEMLRELEYVIDTMGVKSARAQNLSAPITSWIKLRINNHKIYLLKEASGNNGRGTVLGFIKIGRKQLFVLDREGNHNEMQPMCVLDFYVHESQQRKGHGLKLFKHMLQVENIEPHHLAVDRPSSKFTSFLRKHFNLWATIPQVNNFVVFDGFFKNRKDPKRNGSRRGPRFQDENDFRPLSRTASDDFIRRNRQSTFNDNLIGIRPGSGSVLGSGDQQRNYSRYQHSGQSARANMFSRFTAVENGSLPPIPPSRRRGAHRDDDIITNPYRRTTNIYSRSSNSDFTNDNINPESRKPTAVTPANVSGQESLRNKIQEETKQMMCNPAKDRTDQAEDKANGTGSENMDTNVKTNPFSTPQNQSNVTHKSPSRYRKPSDMILELQQKDRIGLQEHNRYSSRHGSRPSSNWFSTSWNVMGVPTYESSRIYKQ